MEGESNCATNQWMGTIMRNPVTMSAITHHDAVEFE
jgi:hypothetical protein